MTIVGTTLNNDHPAKYTESVMRQLRAIVIDEAQRLARPPVLLDPFAGVGRIWDVADVADVTAVEIEPEWAACRNGTIIGDATDLPASWTDRFDMIVTSPCYGNRLADAHNAQDSCKKCKGAGCKDCGWKGLSKRNSYKTSLGRMPTDGSAAVLQWGDRYKDLHRRFLIEANRVLEPGGLCVINMSNHYRGVKIGGVTRSALMRVVEWWVEAMFAQGWYMEAVFPVKTPRMRQGANHRLRAGVEHIIICRKPFPLEESTP